MADRKRDKPRRKSSSTSSRRTARPAASRERRRPPIPRPLPEPEPEPEPELNVSASDHYAREKARRADRRAAAADPLEEARQAFQKMLAKEAEAQRGGRPKGSRTRGGAKAAPEDTDE